MLFSSVLQRIYCAKIAQSTIFPHSLRRAGRCCGQQSAHSAWQLCLQVNERTAFGAHCCVLVRPSELICLLLKLAVPPASAACRPALTLFAARADDALVLEHWLAR